MIIIVEVVMRYRDKIKELEKDVDMVMKEEKEEKELRIAELQTHKAVALIEHHDEIMSRPKRTWFQSHRERQQEQGMINSD